MKKAIGLTLFFLIVHLGFSEYVGKMFVSYDPLRGEKTRALSMQTEELSTFIAGEIARGNLVLKTKDKDPFMEGMEHRRYIQHYQGIPVFGGEIIKHFLDNNLLHVNGYYYRIEAADLSPELSREEAVSVFQKTVEASAFLEKPGDVREIIFPLSEGTYRLGYEVKLKKGPAEYEIGYIDGKTGKILARDTTVIFGHQAIGPMASVAGYRERLSTRRSLERYVQNFFGLHLPWLASEREGSSLDRARNSRGGRLSGIPDDAVSISAPMFPMALASPGNPEIGLGLDYHGYLRKLPT